MSPPLIASVLCIAGSDPSGGAGVQADLKTVMEHGVFGMAAITALTAQNTMGVGAVHVPPAEFVASQVRMVLEDMPVGAVKIGMLATAEVVEAVTRSLRDYAGPVVLDPVMVSTSGHRLLDPQAEAALLEQLVPRATVVTPNLLEAQVLLGDEAPEAWVARTGVALLLKDGHGEGEMVQDRLFQRESSLLVEHFRVRSRNTHGTGCTLSSAVAAQLALGRSLNDAVAEAVQYVARLVERSAGHGLGGGKGPLLHGLVRAVHPIP